MNFGITLAVFVLIVGLFRWWRRGEEYTIYYFLASLVLFSIAVFSPRLLRPIYSGWMKVARMILWVNTVVLLSFVFFLVFTTLALIFRLIKRDILDEQIEKDRDSYWVERQSPESTTERFRRMF